MLRVVDYKRKFRVELSEHIRAVLAIHRKQYFAVRAADKGIFFAQLLAHALKAVYLAVADAVAAVKLERLHSRRIKTHYRETVKAEQTVSGVYYARVVRTARYRFVKACLKIGKGDAACTVAHYRTHISTSSCTIIQHSIGQVLYLAVPPIFFLSPTAASCLIGCRCNGRFPTHLLGSVLAAAVLQMREYYDAFRIAACAVLFAHPPPHGSHRPMLAVGKHMCYFSALRRF